MTEPVDTFGAPTPVVPTENCIHRRKHGFDLSVSRRTRTPASGEINTKKTADGFSAGTAPIGPWLRSIAELD